MLLKAQKIPHLNRPRQWCFQANIAKWQHSIAAGTRVLERSVRNLECRRTTFDYCLHRGQLRRNLPGSHPMRLSQVSYSRVAIEQGAEPFFSAFVCKRHQAHDWASPQTFRRCVAILCGSEEIEKWISLIIKIQI
ncbi:MAG: hypothetical protein ABSD51_01800 [Candidatus Binatus sp.]